MNTIQSCLKTYTVDFGTGKDKMTVVFEKCCNFAECAVRMEFTGFDVTAITNIKVAEYEWPEIVLS